MKLVILLAAALSGVIVPSLAFGESREDRECRYRPSFNCAKADDATSRAICTNPRLLTADCTLGHAYHDAHQQAQGEQNIALRKNQHSWTEARDATCIKRPAHDLAACLKDETEQRIRWLIEHYNLPVAGKVYERYNNAKPKTTRPDGTH